MNDDDIQESSERFRGQLPNVGYGINSRPKEDVHGSEGRAAFALERPKFRLRYPANSLSYYSD